MRSKLLKSDALFLCQKRVHLHRTGVFLVASAVGQILDVGDSVQPDGAVFRIVEGETVENALGTVFQRQTNIVCDVLVIRQRIVHNPAFVVLQSITGSQKTGGVFFLGAGFDGDIPNVLTGLVLQRHRGVASGLDSNDFQRIAGIIGHRLGGGILGVRGSRLLTACREKRQGQNQDQKDGNE